MYQIGVGAKVGTCFLIQLLYTNTLHKKYTPVKHQGHNKPKVKFDLLRATAYILNHRCGAVNVSLTFPRIYNLVRSTSVYIEMTEESFDGEFYQDINLKTIEHISKDVAKKVMKLNGNT